LWRILISKQKTPLDILSVFMSQMSFISPLVTLIWVCRHEDGLSHLAHPSIEWYWRMTNCWVIFQLWSWKNFHGKCLVCPGENRYWMSNNWNYYSSFFRTHKNFSSVTLSNFSWIFKRLEWYEYSINLLDFPFSNSTRNLKREMFFFVVL
jgi:hypothetical protein